MAVPVEKRQRQPNGGDYFRAPEQGLERDTAETAPVHQCDLGCGNERRQAPIGTVFYRIADGQKAVSGSVSENNRLAAKGTGRQSTR